MSYDPRDSFLDPIFSYQLILCTPSNIPKDLDQLPFVLHKERKSLQVFPTIRKNETSFFSPLVNRVTRQNADSENELFYDVKLLSLSPENFSVSLFHGESSRPLGLKNIKGTWISRWSERGERLGVRVP